MGKKNRKIIIPAVFILAIAVAGYSLFKFGEHGEKTPAASPRERSAAVQNTPADSKKNSNSGDSGWGDESGWGNGNAEAPTVQISRAKQQLINVKIATAEIEPMQKAIRTVGVVTYDETRLATVNTKVAGWIEKLYVDYTGMYVKKGQPLAKIYSPELYATQQEYLNVLKWAGKDKKKDKKNGAGGDGAEAGPMGAMGVGRMLANDARSMVAAARQRLKLYDIPGGEIKRIEATGRPIRDLTIYSPVSGYIVQKDAVVGLKAAPGQTLFNVADLSRVWVLADVYEDDLSLVGTGQWADISIGAFPGKVFRARIDYVYPSISGQTRTAKVRFSIPNPGMKLKPQMYSDVLINSNLGRRLVIPASAVIDTGMRQVVYVDKGGGNFEPREITTGVKTDTMVEVLKGLKPGDRVASEGTFLIDSESRLEGVTK
ncbi:MAG: efflux RND transporter periplasmic adaptor subunit [Nitrospiraceae bacterium]|nr:efflux RND transporter periplasmic adaptor subunit [Nitrospiraceae bacterium]